VSEIDEAYKRTQEGDHEAFASWVRLCEAPLRKSLRSFAQAVDVESVLQEGLARMWTLAPRLELEGENASLRYALRLVRNVALSEARRLGRATPVELEELEKMPEGAVDPDPPTDHGLRQAIQRCFDKLPPKPRAALQARLRGGPDRELARSVRMKLNTFLQNIVRARKLMAECLKAAGVNVEEYV
jgi:DNA-directed RNA polymerase specialized sigma24 family protein